MWWQKVTCGLAGRGHIPFRLLGGDTNIVIHGYTLTTPSSPAHAFCGIAWCVNIAYHAKNRRHT